MGAQGDDMNDVATDRAVREKRLKYQSWHRGTREMDIILGQFADKRISSLSEAELEEYTALITLPDTDLYKWISGREAIPDQYQTPLMAAICKLDFLDRSNLSV